MSLWKKTTDNPLSAPTWYARHCYFDGKDNVVDGKIDLAKANTQFEVGDAILYVADDASVAVGGLTNNSVYYVVAIDEGKYSLSATKDGEAVAMSATSDASKQMFIKCDTYETTEDGTLNYAIIPVTIAEAQSAKYGKAINAQGWWRYRRFTKLGKTEATIHAERLVGFKGDFNVTVPSEGINTPDEDLESGNLVIEPKEGTATIKAKSVKVSGIDAKDVTKNVEVTATGGDVDIESGELENATLKVVAQDATAETEEKTE